MCFLAFSIKLILNGVIHKTVRSSLNENSSRWAGLLVHGKIQDYVNKKIYLYKKRIKNEYDKILLPEQKMISRQFRKFDVKFNIIWILFDAIRGH